MAVRKPVVDLGDKVKDLVTGFAGIAVAKTEWLHGCVRIMVQPDTLDKDGKPQEMISFDEPQLEIITAKKVPFGSRDSGGPRPEIKQRPDAR